MQRSRRSGFKWKVITAEQMTPMTDQAKPKTPANTPFHTEPRAARLFEINVVRRGPVNGGVVREGNAK